MRTIFSASILLSLVACTDTTFPGDEYPYCAETATLVAFDEVTPLGTSAADVLAGIPASEQASFAYTNGASASALDVAFTAGAEARFVDSEAVYPEGGEQIDIAVICEDRIEIDGVLAFSTADGVFAEALDVVLTSSAEGTGIFESLDLENMGGTFDIMDYSTATDVTDLGAWISISFADGQSEGVVEGQATTEEACDGDECSVSAESIMAGGWSGGLNE